MKTDSQMAFDLNGEPAAAPFRGRSEAGLSPVANIVPFARQLWLELPEKAIPAVELRLKFRTNTCMVGQWREHVIERTKGKRQ